MPPLGPPLPGAPWAAPPAEQTPSGAPLGASDRRRPVTTFHFGRVPLPPSSGIERGAARRLERLTEQLSVVLNSLVDQGYLVGLDAVETATGALPLRYAARAVPMTGTAPPTTDTDLQENAVPGALYYDSVADRVWFCADDAPAAAHWVPLGASGLSGRTGVILDGTFDAGQLQEDNLHHLPLTHTGATWLRDDGTWTACGSNDSEPVQTVVTDTQFDSTDATLTAVPDLSVTVEAGKTYLISALLVVDADITGGSKFTLSGTATLSSALYFIRVQSEATHAFSIADRHTDLDQASEQNGVVAGPTFFDGTITVATGGTLTIKFAQKTASGTSSVLAGSSFTVREVV